VTRHGAGDKSGLREKLRPEKIQGRAHIKCERNYPKGKTTARREPIDDEINQTGGKMSTPVFEKFPEVHL